MNDYQRYLADEFIEDFQEGRLSRRDALKLIASVTGSMMVASSMLAACAPAGSPGGTPTSALIPEAATPVTGITPAAETPISGTTHEVEPSVMADVTVSPDDTDVQAGDIQFSVEGATLYGYLARPASVGSPPVVLVCHENRGLTEHIKDVTRRLAKAGYAALAVDLLSRQGGTEAVGEGNVPGALGQTPEDQFIQDFLSGWRYIQEQPDTSAERVGMVGFCFGGGVTWRMATHMPELKAAVPFYGPHPPVEDVPAIQAAVLAIYAERDQRINQGIPAIEQAMQENGKIYEKVVYPDTDHAFHNDTGSRYNAEAAANAWARTLEWFDRYVRDT
jgi:carboxymethylenebutenolidase